VLSVVVVEVGIVLVLVVIDVVVELPAVVLMKVELLFVTSVQSPSTPPLVPLAQESAYFSLQANRHEPPPHPAISKVPLTIG
jgi:hypothetical protein